MSNIAKFRLSNLNSFIEKLSEAALGIGKYRHHQTSGEAESVSVLVHFTKTALFYI